MKPNIEALQEYFATRNDAYAFVVLFGSAAKEAMHSMSDVDIGVWLRKQADMLQIGYDTAKLEGVCERRVHIVALNDVYKTDPLFAMEVLKAHRVLALFDETAYVDFKRNAQLYYLDHLPLITMQRRTFKKRIDEGKVGERNYA